MRPSFLGGLVIHGFLLACGPVTPAPTAPVSEAPAEAARSLEKTAEALAAALARGDEEQLVARFDDSMRGALSAAQLRELWASLAGQLGSFQRIEGTRSAERDGYRIVRVRIAFERSPVELKLVFDAEERISGLFVEPASEPGSGSPPYARADAFEEHEVTVGSGRWALPGTLSLPKAGRPCPAVVLVHGSGPNDRDETVGANKPFRDLAHGLASRNIAVLRYEKRTRQHGAALVQELGESLTLEQETVDDVLAAATLLRGHDAIDAERIFVLGHSAGGTAMPRIARRDAELRGFVILAGSTEPLEDIVYRQLEYISKLDGTISEREREILARLKAQGERVKELTKESSVAASDLPLGIPVAYWLDLAAHPPTEEIAGEKRPILVLHGDRDYQVSLADFEGWKRALGSSPAASFKRYPKLNHLFIEGEGKSAPTEYQKAGHVPAYVVDDIAAWISER
jgi:hypothetical protein